MLLEITAAQFAAEGGPPAGGLADDPGGQQAVERIPVRRDGPGQQLAGVLSDGGQAGNGDQDALEVDVMGSGPFTGQGAFKNATASL